MANRADDDIINGGSPAAADRSQSLTDCWTHVLTEHQLTDHQLTDHQLTDQLTDHQLTDHQLTDH